MTLSAEIVDFIGFDIENQVGNTLAVSKVSIVEEEFGVWIVRISIDMVNPRSIEAAATTHDAVDIVSFF